MIDLTVAVDKLAQFQTADEIANYFRGESVTGCRRINTRCPIANWVTAQTQQLISVGYHTIGTPDRMEREKNTDAMKDFVEKFDNGKYPDLEVGYMETIVQEVSGRREAVK